MNRSVASVGATVVLGALLLAVGSGGDTTNDQALQLANLAWERGDYIGALTAYQKILRSADAERLLEPIALQTGELYRTIELTPDGAAPKFSPDSRYITYETGPVSARITRLVPADGTTKAVAELHGFGAAFSQDGSKLAYLKLEPTPELMAAFEGAERAPEAERTQQLAAVNARIAADARIVVRDLADGRETDLEARGYLKSAVAFGAGGIVLFTGVQGSAGPHQIYSIAEGRQPAVLTSDEGDKQLVDVNASGTAVVYGTRSGGGRGGRGAGAGGGRGAISYGIMALPGGKITPLASTGEPAFSADGRSIAYVAREGEEYRLIAGGTSGAAAAAVVRRGPERMDAVALSGDGSRIAYQMMPHEDWEIYVTSRDGAANTRVTRDIQHDVLPQFVTRDRMLAVVGERRHRRSFLYDLSSGARIRLFHNNTVRTIAPEYSWTANAEGTKILVVAERDGDTVSPERGIYLIDLSRRVTLDDVRARVASNLASEQALQAKGKRIYAPIAADVKSVVAEASVARVYGYEKALFDFDSKHISRPGNKLASAFLFDAYKSFGYEPEYQWFSPRGALDGRTANVVATLKGTVNPELIYVVSSHYDSVAAGPGADDDSSGTAALLETARLLAKHPQPATIVFASFTGEEAGLLGSREFVRRAVADKLHVVGALNNDMVGWANDYHLDATIRYSNPGIKDVQHAAAAQFTNLITYDARYYKSTDAESYYQAYGDIVGGIGSYPVLSSPHYHQSHDQLDTINHQLVTEVAKTTVATLMLLASSPSRLTGLKVDSFNGGSATISWTPSPEKGVSGYIVAYGPQDKPEAQQTRVTRPVVKLSGLTPGTLVSVKAVNAKGLEGWDWAKVTIK